MVKKQSTRVTLSSRAFKINLIEGRQSSVQAGLLSCTSQTLSVYRWRQDHQQIGHELRNCSGLDWTQGRRGLPAESATRKSHSQGVGFDVEWLVLKQRAYCTYRSYWWKPIPSSFPRYTPPPAPTALNRVPLWCWKNKHSRDHRIYITGVFRHSLPRARINVDKEQTRGF